MDYKKVYDQIIERAQKESKVRKEHKKNGGYYEGHHIIPKCLGGKGDTQDWNHPNIIPLTAREHFITHWLLHRIHPEDTKLSFCFWRMCNGKGKVKDENWIKISSRTYEEGKLAFREGIKRSQRGRRKSPEHVAKVAAANIGKKRDATARHNMSIAAKSRPVSKGFYKMIESRKVQNEKQKKPVAMLDIKTLEVLKKFSSLKEAAESVDRNSSNLLVAIKNNKTSAGFKWKYLH